MADADDLKKSHPQPAPDRVPPPAAPASVGTDRATTSIHELIIKYSLRRRIELQQMKEWK